MRPYKSRKLAESARESAKFRGHTLAHFAFDEHGRGSAECRVCGMGAHVDPNPPPNGIDVSGSAVAVNCTDDTRRRTITSKDMLAYARWLVNGDGADGDGTENPEYTRAIVELCCDCLGYSMDEKNDVARLLGVKLVGG